MKIISKHIEKDKSGYVNLILQESEDFWHIYNILDVNDKIRASTTRKVKQFVQGGGSGQASSFKARTTTTIKVTHVEFTWKDDYSLRLKGINVEENEFIKLNQYHTLELELNSKFTLTKSAWDSMHLERLEEVCDITKVAEIGACTIQEGLANISLITNYSTVVIQKVELTIPKKRGPTGAADYDKAIGKFMEYVYLAVIEHLDIEKLKVIIFAGPGFMKEKIVEHINQKTQQNNIKKWTDNKGKILTVNASNAYKHSLNEVLNMKNVQSLMLDTKSMKQMQTLNQFTEMMEINPYRAVYGSSHVLYAYEQGAIETLMMTDEMFRAKTVEQRQKYIKMVEEVRKLGGKVLIYSVLHVSGEQLKQFSGIAAILKYPIPEIDEIEIGDICLE